MKMLEHSPGQDLLPMELPESTSSQAGFPARRSVRRLVDVKQPRIFGRKWHVWSISSGQALPLRKMSHLTLSPGPQTGFPNWGCNVTWCVYLGLMSGLRLQDAVGGLLHTPTKTANFKAPSMQKWPSCRRYTAAFGDRKITGPLFAFLMGYPADWALESTATPLFPKSPK